MSKYKVKDSIWFVLADGIRIYFSNIDKFLLYMLFPVLGQVVGIVLSFGLTLGLSEHVIAKADSIPKALLLVVLLAMPGLLIFVKAFWEYMVAYVALNSMTEGAITTGKVYDFQSHKEVATRRVLPFVLLLFFVGVLSSLGSSIFLMIPGAILWVYFVLVYQVFTFEPELSVPDCFKRSFMLVRGHWLRTAILMCVLGFFSIYIITEGFSVVFNYLNLTDKICSSFNFITNLIQLDMYNKALAYFNLPIITPDMISKAIFHSLLLCIVMGLTLPIRSICYTIWYTNLTELMNVPQKRGKRVPKNNREDVEE